MAARARSESQSSELPGGSRKGEASRAGGASRPPTLIYLNCSNLCVVHILKHNMNSPTGDSSGFRAVLYYTAASDFVI